MLTTIGTTELAKNNEDWPMTGVLETGVKAYSYDVFAWSTFRSSGRKADLEEYERYPASGLVE